MATPQVSPRPVLEFDTLNDGLPIRIDGQLYHLRSANALSLGALKRLERLAPRMGALLQQADLSEAEERDVSAGLVQLCDLVVDAPAEVRARLTDAQRVRILEAFTQLPSPRVTGAIPGRGAARGNGGKRPSRGSRGSTAGLRRSGTSTPPSA